MQGYKQAEHCSVTATPNILILSDHYDCNLLNWNSNLRDIMLLFYNSNPFTMCHRDSTKKLNLRGGGGGGLRIKFNDIGEPTMVGSKAKDNF